MTAPDETEYAELIKGLRRNQLFGDEFAGRAASAFSSLIADNARLREALKPFVAEALLWGDPLDNWKDGDAVFGVGSALKVGDLRRARAALNGEPS
jgi:hypothetical protein